MNHATALSPSFAAHAPVIQVGECELDLDLRALRRGGKTVELGSRAFDVLATIALAAGRVVSKDELMEAVWPDTIVEENNIHVQLSAIRKALGADRALILTVPGRGYQLAAAPETRIVPMPRHEAGPARAPNELRAGEAVIGRDTAIAEILSLMSSARIVTLVGAGGIGKTRIAREIAHRLAAEQALDVRLVELAAHATRAAVVQAFADVCGAPFNGKEPDARIVANGLAGLPGLLVIDNAEHVVEHVAEIVDLTSRANPQMTILVTSRSRLRVSLESVYRVGPLALPHAGEDRDAMLRSPAIALFLRRLRSNGVSAEMSDERLRMAEEICRRLAGIPLALELAAGRASLLGLEGIRERLDEPLLYVAGGYRTAQPRHQSLRAAFDWSFDMLDAAEQTVFRRLSVFNRAFTVQAASEVARDATLSNEAVMDCIGELVDKSLIEIQFEGADVKYHLFAPARAYGLEKLLAAGEICTIFERHALFASGHVAHGRLSGVRQ
ncbi:ATP-binding protein [Paraburkholderia sacchari]|uniref:Helix-turn-helix transcriptional regulator n=1 Tax=Paraburkholderia sacchari TaxID=159450 RepID=A0A8T6ZKN3_9BURK|nr:winged helix-turn-helix domain-containing protein [Paraburkholderia sacchari]NLP64834.1 helix-turn-helix transcriptional regulator [Paraburkholderia sacchari]